MNSKIVSSLLIALLFLGIMAAVSPRAFAAPTIRVISEESELGDPITMPNIIGTEFDIAVVIEDIVDLYGIDVQINWTTKYLHCIDHTMTVPVDTFPSPIPPSPYAGILHPGMPLADVVDESDNIPGAEVGAMGYWGYSSMGTPPFDGDGTVAVLTFKVVNQPWDYETTEPVNATIHFVSVKLSDTGGDPIVALVQDFTITIYPRYFEYPPLPMLKVSPSSIEGVLGATFPVDVLLMDENEDPLSPFWDINGFDMYLNFNSTLIEALDVTIDPDGWWAGFWPGGVIEAAKEIDNIAGTVHITFMGLPDITDGSYISPNGIGRLVTVDFNATFEYVGYPPPTCSIWLENPLAAFNFVELDADDGIIDLATPETTQWTKLTPASEFGETFSLEISADNDGDMKLSAGDEVNITNTVNGKWLRYIMDDIKGTLTLEQQPFPCLDDLIWAASWGPDNMDDNGIPGVCTEDMDAGVYDGYGLPYWTGNFSVTYPLASVNSITANFVANGTTKVLTAGVDYKVYPDEDLIELITPIDVPITNEYWVDGVNNTLNGWPMINYISSGIQSVYVKFPNGTERYAVNNGYAAGPPGEWWYDPDWTWELEGWWALGYFGGPETWPAGSAWWINYTAASYLTVDYNAESDPVPRYAEFGGSYGDFLALGDPLSTIWNEVWPLTWRSYNVTGWIDSDTSGDITVGDYLDVVEAAGNRTYLVLHAATDIKAIEEPVICKKDLSCKFYGMKRIVEIAGYPHDERPMCPWHNSESSVPIPHVVQDATYTAPFKVLGAAIDVFTQYPYPFGGQGPNNPSDMYWPQKEVCLFANVTYNLWPEQQKDVAFEVIDPYGNVYTILGARTDSDGTATVCFRLPWMCDDPEYYFGEWTVIATVDVACKHINDTMNFKYDYMVHIWKVTTDQTSYAHSEYIHVEVEYGSWALQPYHILLTITGLDETGVPFDYGHVWIWVGGENAVYCTYMNDTTGLDLYIPKWARAGKATIEVNALWPSLPRYGGVAQCPLVTTDVTIRAE
jgi:hypothetical protein